MHACMHACARVCVCVCVCVRVVCAFCVCVVRVHVCVYFRVMCEFDIAGMLAAVSPSVRTSLHACVHMVGARLCLRVVRA